jgi:hypothetical protein
MVALMSAGCTAASSPGGAHPTGATTAAPTSSAAADGISAHFQLDDFALTVSAPNGVAEAPLTAVPAPSPPPEGVPYYTDAQGRGVALTLPGDAQPDAPLTLTFDFSAHPDALAGVSDARIPVVVAKSVGVDEPEVLASRWDPEHRILTATTTHLTSFFPSLLDVGKLRDRLVGALKGYLGQASEKPSCVGQPVTVAGATYTVNPVARDIVWPCLEARDGKIVLTVHANSPLGWILYGAPAPSDTHISFPPELDGAATASIYKTILAPAVGTGTFLVPGGSTELVFDPSAPPQHVSLRAEAAMTLVNDLVYGLHAAFPKSTALLLTDTVQCIATVVKGTQYEGDTSGVAYGDLNKGLIGCVKLAVEHLVNDPADLAKSFANRTVGAVLTLLDGGGLLITSLRGVIGEFTGENTADLVIQSSAGTPASATPTPVANQDGTLHVYFARTANGNGEILSPTLFRLDPLSRWFDLNYFWHVESPPPWGDRFCLAHVRITDSAGHELNRHDMSDFNACVGGGAWAANTRITTPGVYTITVDAEQVRGRATLHATQQVTVLAP